MLFTKKMFDILDHQGNAHLNYSVFYMPPVRISIVKKISDLKKKILARMRGRGAVFTDAETVNWRSPCGGDQEGGFSKG